MGSLLRRVWYMLRRRRLEADLADEIEFHRAMKARELGAAGLSPDDAAREAARALGNVRLAQEDARDVWIAPSLHGLSQDIRFAIRGLLHDRAFTLAASCIPNPESAPGLSFDITHGTIRDSKIRDSRSFKIKDSGCGIRDQGSGMSDEG